jgi:hypothetical protein
MVLLDQCTGHLCCPCSELFIIKPVLSSQQLLHLRIVYSAGILCKRRLVKVA